MPSLVIDINPFCPDERTVERIPKNRKIAALCPVSDWPVICIYNGRPLLRAGWNRRVKHGDVVAFVACPRGGGGGSLLRVVAAIAVAVIAPQIAVAMGFTAGTVGFAMATAAIGLVGNMVMNAMLPAAKLPLSQAAAADIQAASPTYSIGAQGNAARLEQPIPVQYGRCLAYPDFATTPWQEYVGNDQYLYQLFLIGQGSHSVEQVRIEDTDISSFSGATFQVVMPGQAVTLFPANVVQSTEVAGGELLTDAVSGPYTINTSGTQISIIGFDLACPGGLYYANDQGTLDSMSVTVRFDVCPIDDIGNPVGGWVSVGQETISGATNTAIRRSFRYNVALARYQARAVRVDSKDTRSRAAHAVNWAGLRGYFPEQTDFGDVTLLAVQLRADSQLSAQASRKINVISTRMIPVWTPWGGWSGRTATRSIAWALADICRADYGGNMSDDRYDLAGLYALDQVWNARGDTFDGRFDTKSTVGEALTLVALAGRAKWFQQYGQVRFWRDQLQTLPVMVFKPRTIKPGTFKLHYSPAVTDTADSVRASYFDERFWSQRDVTCVPDGSAGVKIKDINLFGVVKRQQVINETGHMARCNVKRRLFATFETEADGYLLRYGDLVGVSHDMPAWGQSGDCIGWDAVSRRLFLSEPPSWTAGQQHVIVLTRADGSVTGKINVSQDATYDNAVILGADPGFTPETAGVNRLRTTYAFGSNSTVYIEALVSRITPKEDFGCEIEVVVEDRSVHTDGQETSVDLGGSQLPSAPSAPIVGTVVVVEGGSPSSPVQHVSWGAAAGASHYYAEYTTDGSNWRRFADTTALGADLANVPPGASLNIRVCALNLLRGPWVYWIGVSGDTVSAPGNIANIALEKEFSGPAAIAHWSPAVRADSYRVEIWNSNVMRRQVFIKETRYEYTVGMSTQDGGPWRDFEFRVTPIGIGHGATAVLPVSNPNIGQLNDITVSATTGGALWACDLPPDPDVAGYLVWASIVSGFTPSGDTLVGNFSSPVGQVMLPAGYTWRLRFAAYDQWGMDGLNISGEFSVTPGKITSTQISDQAVLTPHLGAGTVTAEKMLVDRLSAITGNLGTVNTGQLNITSDGVGGYGYARSAGKWWDDGANGWVMARALSGESFAEIKAGVGRLWFSSWGDFGLQMPGISMGPGGLVINQLDVIDSANIKQAAIKTAHIGEAEVDTLRIAGHAVTVPTAGAIENSALITLPWVDYGGGTVLLMCSVNQPVLGGLKYLNVYRDGIRVFRARITTGLVPVPGQVDESGQPTAWNVLGGGSLSYIDVPGPGGHYYQCGVSSSEYAPDPSYCTETCGNLSMITLSVKR